MFYFLNVFNFELFLLVSFYLANTWQAYAVLAFLHKLSGWEMHGMRTMYQIPTFPIILFNPNKNPVKLFLIYSGGWGWAVK